MKLCSMTLWRYGLGYIIAWLVTFLFSIIQYRSWFTTLLYHCLYVFWREKSCVTAYSERHFLYTLDFIPAGVFLALDKVCRPRSHCCHLSSYCRYTIHFEFHTDAPKHSASIITKSGLVYKHLKYSVDRLWPCGMEIAIALGISHSTTRASFRWVFLLIIGASPLGPIPYTLSTTPPVWVCRVVE